MGVCGRWLAVCMEGEEEGGSWKGAKKGSDGVSVQGDEAQAWQVRTGEGGVWDMLSLLSLGWDEREKKSSIVFIVKHLGFVKSSLLFLRI